MYFKRFKLREWRKGSGEGCRYSCVGLPERNWPHLRPAGDAANRHCPMYAPEAGACGQLLQPQKLHELQPQQPQRRQKQLLVLPLLLSVVPPTEPVQLHRLQTKSGNVIPATLPQELHEPQELPEFRRLHRLQAIGIPP